MRTWVYSLLLLLLISCSNETKLRPICGNAGYGKCYAVPGVSEWLPDDEVSWKLEKFYKSRAGKGSCNLGAAVCDENYKIVECKGDVPPVPEECNDIDDDCDGDVDEDLQDLIASLVPYRREYNQTGNPVAPCKLFGECYDSRASCVLGEWVCDYPGDVEFPNEETFDCKDNDCDGRADEGILPDTCFDDEFWKATQGSCKPGFDKCVDYEVICDGQILPQEEICGDRIDNDCNGLIDDTTTTVIVLYDIVLIIDTSGSMCGKILAVLGALDAYVSQFEGDPNYKFAIVLMTYELGNLVEKLVDFSDITVVRSTLQSLGCTGSGLEASLDALHDVCLRDDSDLDLSWRQNSASLLFSFTDEPPQSYVAPRTDADMIVNACLDNGVLPFQWSTSPTGFEPIVQAAGGLHFQLVNDFQTIFDDLNSVVIQECVGF